MAFKHIVRQGDDIASIAAANGIRHWKRVWALDENRELRELRRDPFRLNPGDVVWVPPVSTSSKQYAVEQTHDIKIKRTWFEYALRIEDERGEPLANASYRFSRDGLPDKEGTTDDHGVAKLKIGAHSKRGIVVVLDDAGQDAFAIDLSFGELDAPGTRSAALAQARALAPGVGVDDDRVLVMHVQSLLGLEQSGELDPQTMSLLEIWYGKGFAEAKKLLEENADER